MATCLVFKNTPIYNVIGGQKIGDAFEGQAFYSFGEWGSYIGITFNYPPFVGYISNKDACVEKNLMNLELEVKKDAIVYKGPSTRFASAGLIKRKGEKVMAYQLANNFYRIGPQLWIHKSAFGEFGFDWSLVLGASAVLIFGLLSYRILKRKVL